MKRLFFLLAMGLSLGHSSFLRADDGPLGGLRLSYWTYGVKGDATVHGSQAGINNTNKVLNGDNWGFALGGDVRWEGWGVDLDLFIGRQSNSQQLSSSQSVKWDADFAVLTAGAFIPLVNKDLGGDERNFEIDGIAGLRSFTNGYKLQFEPYDPVNSQNRSDYVSWLDPYLGLRIQAKLGPAWTLGLYGDAGGFGIGHASELSVLTHADIGWTVMKGLNVIGGYRLFDLKTANESGDQKTQIDLRMAGPTLGAEMRF